ncbi:MAG: 16S rRNA (cytosine(967)-C(5))-methyltransferase RsmB [Acidobacteriia bacterium]|nr:16S rRNA (cytosine(967)-C(5))-methyltransferase RsmB [Terriglobia bacterium]
MPLSPARSAAFQILLRVEREAAYADELLHSPLLEPLSQPDRNLTTEIVMGVLRWRSALDSAFSRLLSTPVAKLDLEVLTALRMGVYQLAFLDRIPRHAVVHEAVELVKQARKRSAAGMVNAILRKITPGRAGLPAENEDPAVAFAHPAWLVEKWTTQFGREKTAGICRFDQQKPVTALRCRNEDARKLLHAEGIECAPGALLKNALVVVSGDVTRSSLFRNSQIAIQDEGSQLVASLISDGNLILDCCAAPGGKTAAMADALPAARIVAAEIHPHRARLLRKMAPQTNVEVITADTLQLPLAAEFDRVLADVPCSGTGTLARNPEIKWKLVPEDLMDLQSRQIAILNAVMKHVAPGGRLVYSTCSLEVEENEQVVEACLRTNPDFMIVPAADELETLQKAGTLVWKNVNELVSGNYLRTLPGVHPCDGFFAAIVHHGSKQNKLATNEHE